MQSVKLFWRLLSEIRTGTIEQVYLSPLPSWVVAAAGRMVAALIETLILMGMTYGIVSAFVTPGGRRFRDGSKVYIGPRSTPTGCPPASRP